MADHGGSQDLVGMIQAIVRNELARMKIAELGVITDLFAHRDGSDANNYQCSVRLRDTGLELHRVPVAVGRIGLAMIPDIGDLVLVQFIGGDIHGAVITGRLYNDEDRQPEAGPREMVYVSPHGEEPDVRRLYMEFPNGNTLRIDDDQVHVEAGSTTLTLANNGEVKLVAEGAVQIQSRSSTTVKSGGNLVLEAGGNLEMSARGEVKVEGLSVSLKGMTTTTVEGTAMTTLKGAMVNIKGLTNFTLG